MRLFGTNDTSASRSPDIGPPIPRSDEQRGRRWLSLTWWEQSKFGQLFGADLRSLAILRIVMAAIVLADVVGRVPDLRIHYTNEGVMPRSLLVDDFVRWRWSLNLINDTYAFQAAILLVTALAACAMLVGYRTRLATIAVFVLVTSIQVRNPFVLSGADTLLRVLSFWLMFLPLGAAWSLDSRNRRDRTPISRRFLSFGTIGFFLQICLMYWFTAALKSDPEWRTDGTALYYALGAHHITKPFGEWLHQFPDVLRVLTHASLGLEILAPILLFCPIFTGPIRTIAIASIMSFHLGIYLTMDVGIFPWTSALCMTSFLPSWFWDALMPRVRAVLPARIVPDFQQWRLTGSRALERLSPIRERLGSGWVYLAFASSGGRPARDNSPVSVPGTSGGDDTEAPPKAEQRILRSSPITNAVLAFCLVFVFLWNWTSVSDFTLPAEAAPVGYSTGLYQRWNMFAPHPSKGTVWIVVRGVLKDGRQIDLLTPIVHGDLTHVPVISWEQPDDIVGEYYKDKYWRKYLTALGRDSQGEERRAFAGYACRTWNDYYGGDVRLVGLQIIKMSQRTLPDYEEAPRHRSVIAEYRCG